jgi:hypothetical protein
MRVQEMPRGTPVAKAWPMQTPATTAAGARLRAWQSSRPMQLKATRSPCSSKTCSG